MMNGKWTYERLMLTATFLGGVFISVFGFGVHWAKITAVEAKLEAQASVSIRRDVYTADQLRLSESIDRLTIEMERLRASLESERERRFSPRPSSPR